MKRHRSDLDPELEAFVTPRKIQRETPPELRARVLARARAIVRGRGDPALSRARSPAGTEGAGTARSPSGLDRVRGVGRGGRRRGRSGGGALRPTRALAANRRAGACGPGAERSADERRHPGERTARTRHPDRGGQGAPPGASRRESGPVHRRARSASARSWRLHAPRLLGRADADRGARTTVPARAPRRAARGVARAIARGLWPCGRSASRRGCVRDPISAQCSAAAGRRRLGIRRSGDRQYARAGSSGPARSFYRCWRCLDAKPAQHL